MAGAGVSIAVGDARGSVKTGADINILSSSLEPIVAAVVIARDAVRKMRSVILFSSFYNVVACVCASLGWISPLGAAIAMPVSSACVLIIASGGGRASEFSCFLNSFEFRGVAALVDCFFFSARRGQYADLERCAREAVFDEQDHRRDQAG